MVDISKSTEFYQNQEQQSCAAKLCSKATFSVQKFMEINLNPGFFLPASEYFRRHKDVQKRHSSSLSPLLEALTMVLPQPQNQCNFTSITVVVPRLYLQMIWRIMQQFLIKKNLNFFLLISGLSARKNHHRSKLFATPSSSQLASRRLSSPPSLDKSGEEFFSDKIRKSRRQRNNGVDDCDIDGGGGSGSSNGSLNKLCISGLNPSSSDLHQIISGHQVLSKYLHKL